MVNEFLLEWYFKVIDTWITNFHTRYKICSFYILYFIFFENLVIEF